MNLSIKENLSTHKFNFNHNLDDLNHQDRLSYAGSAELNINKKVVPTFSEAELAAASAKAKQEGYQESLNSLEAESQKIITLLLEKLDTLVSAEAALEKHFQEQSFSFSCHLFEKLFPEISASHQVPAIENFVKENIHQLMDKTQLTIFVPTETHEVLSKRLISSFEDKGYKNTVLVEADDTLKEIECRIEWSKGGIEKKISHLWDKFYESFPPAKLPEESTASQLSESRNDTEESEQNDVTDEQNTEISEEIKKEQSENE